jgi:hydroxymethylpyrimidine kinase/phosphomethylpyrimidine kinase
MPLARVLTPNIPEAERLTGLRVTDEEGMRCAAQRLREMGARAVLIKGGHLSGQDREGVEPEANTISSVPDLLDEDGRVTIFRGERIETTSTHGTGCTLAAAIAACLARGLSLHDSIANAKRFVTDALRQAPGLGQGFGPIHHDGRVTNNEKK